MGVRRPEGRALTYYHSWSVTDLTGREAPLGKTNTALPLQQEEGTFPSLPGNSTHEKLSSTWTVLTFLRWAFDQNNPFFFLKQCPSPLQVSLKLAYPDLQIFCYSHINSSSGKITGCLTFNMGSDISADLRLW